MESNINLDTLQAAIENIANKLAATNTTEDDYSLPDISFTDIFLSAWEGAVWIMKVLVFIGLIVFFVGLGFLIPYAMVKCYQNPQMIWISVKDTVYSLGVYWEAKKRAVEHERTEGGRGMYVQPYVEDEEEEEMDEDKGSER